MEPIDQDKLDLTVLLPTLNEGTHLAELLAGVKEAAQGLGVPYEILVLEGGSSDDTAKIAQDAGARVVGQRGRGFGSAIREGLKEARGRHVLAMDADGSHPTRYWKAMWEKRDQSDLIIGSRFVPGGSACMPWSRYALSRILNGVIGLILNVPILDSSSGFRLYRRKAVCDIPTQAEDFSIQQELLVGLLSRGGKALEIPFRYEWRMGGKSKARVLAFGLSYLGLLRRLKRLADSDLRRPSH